MHQSQDEIIIYLMTFTLHICHMPLVILHKVIKIHR